MAETTTRFGPLTPDLPTFGTPGTDVIENVLPARNGFRPARRLVSFTEALNERVLNSIFVESSSGVVAGFAATRQDLFRLERESFDRVTRNVDESYNTLEGGTWDFELFEDDVFATNFEDDVQVYNLNGSIDFAPVGIVPRGRYLMTINGFLFLLHINESGLVRPTGVRWSARDRPREFPAPGTTEAVQGLSDRRILASRYGEITGGETGLVSADGVVFQESAVTSINFVGGRRTFSFTVIEGARGCNSPGSIVQVAGLVFYLSDEGFFLTDGTSSTPIGTQIIDETFYKRISVDSLSDIRSGSDVRLKLVYWNVKDNNGERITFVYNYDIKEWSILNNEFQVQVFTRSLTPGFTFADLDRLSDTLDGLPASLDDDIFKGGGIPLFSGFDEQNALGTFTGLALAAKIQTPEIEPAKDGRVYVQFSRPLVDSNLITVTPITRDDLSDQRIIGIPKEKGPEGTCRHRKTARYWGLQLDIQDGADWDFAQGVQVVYENGGNRRPTTPIRTADIQEQLQTERGVPILDARGQRVDIVDLTPALEDLFLITFTGDSLTTFAGDRIQAIR